jgi:hypothetical protein
MRKTLLIIGLIATLIALDAIVNDFRFTGAVLAELKEFIRLVNRFVGHTFSF